MKKGQSGNLNYTGARALLCAVIEQAVTDFKELVAAGRIVNGTVMPAGRRPVRDYRTDAEVQALLDFFTGGVMDEWIFLAGIRINPNLIREKLGITAGARNPRSEAPGRRSGYDSHDANRSSSSLS